MGPVEDLDTRGVRRFLAESTGTNNTKACRIVIGVPASWCGCASVSAEGLPKGNAEQREQAMAFRLESELPITAEDCAIGLLQGQDPGTHLGVAVESSRLAELVHGLEDDGHEVEAIVPRGLLTAQAYLGRATPDDLKQSVGLVWHESDGADGQGQTQLLLVGPNQSPRWRVLDTTPEALAQQLALDDDATQATRVWKLETNCKSIYRPVIEQRGSNVSIESVTLAGQAEEQAALRILERRQRPWVDLRRGPLAPRHVWRRLRFPASACVAAAAILLVTAIALLWLRADEYNHLAQQHDEQGRRAFAEAMPGQAVPTSPQRRLKTRIKQLRGEQGLAAGDEQLTDQSPTLLLLHDLLAGLPTDQRFAITDLRLEDGDLRLTGQARTHGEADQLANTLRTRSPFIVEPPSTDSLTKDKGVRFTIQATYRPPNQQASQPDKPDALVRRDGEARP
jgi:type II secretion system protein L